MFAYSHTLFILCACAYISVCGTRTRVCRCSSIWKPKYVGCLLHHSLPCFFKTSLIGNLTISARLDGQGDPRTLTFDAGIIGTQSHTCLFRSVLRIWTQIFLLILLSHLSSPYHIDGEREREERQRQRQKETQRHREGAIMKSKLALP